MGQAAHGVTRTPWRAAHRAPHSAVQAFKAKGKPLRIPILLVCALLAACASSEKSSLQSAATTPLNDLNVVNAPIPEVLLNAQKAPYEWPSPSSCAEIQAAIRSLDEVLGPDLDAPVTAANIGLIERGGGLLTGAVQNAAEGLIPYRGWVRKLSGAERYSKQVAAAIAAGTGRRAFLKGIVRGRDCQ
jgi:hypothetical protein